MMLSTKRISKTFTDAGTETSIHNLVIKCTICILCTHPFYGLFFFLDINFSLLVLSFWVPPPPPFSSARENPTVTTQDGHYHKQFISSRPFTLKHHMLVWKLWCSLFNDSSLTDKAVFTLCIHYKLLYCNRADIVGERQLGQEALSTIGIMQMTFSTMPTAQLHTVQSKRLL